MVTGIPTAPCTNPYGDYLLSLSIQNKQDYARLHSYELHLMAEAVTSHVRAGPWQKVGFIQKVSPMVIGCHGRHPESLPSLLDHGIVLPLKSYPNAELMTLTLLTSSHLSHSCIDDCQAAGIMQSAACRPWTR